MVLIGWSCVCCLSCALTLYPASTLQVCTDLLGDQLPVFVWTLGSLNYLHFSGTLCPWKLPNTLASWEFTWPVLFFFFFFCLCVVTLELPGILLERRNKFYGYWRGPGVGCRRKQESSEDWMFRHALWVRIFHCLLSVTALQRFVYSPPPGQMTTFS